MRQKQDEGSAMLITLLVMAVLTGLGAIVFNVGFANLQNANRDRLAGGAMGASEGGIAQALAFIRQNGTATLKCTVPEVSGNCDALWGKDNPKFIPLANAREYRVWVEKIQPFNPPNFKVGVYKIHSEGTAGTGPGKRSIELTVSVRPLTFPIGMYSDNFSDSGGAQVYTESMFSRGCILNRDAIQFSGTDRYHNIPASAHSTEYITETNNSCGENDNGNIHSNSQKQCPSSPNYTVYANDQDKKGGPFASDSDGAICLANSAFTSSFFDLAELEKYGYSSSRPRGLSDAEYAALKSKAQEQGYFATTSVKCSGVLTPPSCWNKPDPTVHPNSVLYFDLRSQIGGLKTLDIQSSDFADPTDPSKQMYGKDYCGTRSLIIVVEGGNMTANANLDIVGAIFVPDGTYKGNGNAEVIGTLFAKNVDKFTGTAQFSLDGPSGNTNCFFDNFPGGLLDVTPTRFHEADR